MSHATLAPEETDGVFRRAGSRVREGYHSAGRVAGGRLARSPFEHALDCPNGVTSSGGRPGRRVYRFRGGRGMGGNVATRSPVGPPDKVP